jgi:hypothetical protein
MASELPYFRFTVAEWLNGDISIEDYECKGLFIDVCSWYWFKDCSVTKAMLEKKYNNLRLLQLLYDSEVIKLDGENIHIEFLDEQFDILSDKRKARQRAGRKGGKQKSSNAKAKLKQNSSYKDKYKDNNKDNNKDKMPAWDDFLKYAKEKKEDINEGALRFKYDSWKENGWKDGHGKKIVNWKSKLLNTIPYIKEKPESKNLYPGYRDSSFD